MPHGKVASRCPCRPKTRTLDTPLQYDNQDSIKALTFDHFSLKTPQSICVASHGLLSNQTKSELSSAVTYAVIYSSSTLHRSNVMKAIACDGITFAQHATMPLNSPG